jgi:ribosome-associated translation inhibitor RaiA
MRIMTFRMSFQGDVPHSRRVEAWCRELAQGLQVDFPEAHKFEVCVSRSGTEHEAHVHVVGKDLKVAASAHRRALHEAVGEALTRAERQLRKRHDKQIFVRRREAQRTAPL